jgi:hypothetical protein
LTSVRIALPECPVAGTSLTSRLLAEVTRTWRSPALVYFTHYLKELLWQNARLNWLIGLGKVLHTYPITLTVTNPTPRDADYEMAALSAAKMAKLVPDADTSSLIWKHACAQPRTPQRNLHELIPTNQRVVSWRLARSRNVAQRCCGRSGQSADRDVADTPSAAL